VVQRLGTIEYVTVNEIEGLFAADLAFLQDFYSVVNFGDQEEYEALLCSTGLPRPDLVVAAVPAGAPVDPAGAAAAASAGSGGSTSSAEAGGSDGTTGQDEFESRPGRVPSPPTRRDAILEVTATGARA
jgi:hypothetical protein